MKIGDLVRLPEDSHYWWGSKVGLIIGLEANHINPERHALRILVAARDPGYGHVKFGANFVELISEAK